MIQYVPIGLACDDCAIAITNDDYSGMDANQADATHKGIARYNHLVVAEEYGFSWRGCSVCQSSLGGNKHNVGYLEYVDTLG